MSFAEITIGPLKYHLTKDAVPGITLGEVSVCGTSGEEFSDVLFIPSKIQVDTEWFIVTRIESLAITKSTVKTIIMPTTLKGMNVFAFDYYDSLKEILIDPASESFQSVNGVLYNKNLTELVRCPNAIEEINIPTTLKEIHAGAFRACKRLKFVQLPDSIETIGAYAFGGCHSLEQVIFSKNLKLIEICAFAWCRSLKEVELFGHHLFIDNHVFHECTSLLSVNLRDGVDFICKDVFEDCTSLINITIGATLTGGLEYQFNSCESLSNIEVVSENPRYTSKDGILYSKDFTELIKVPASHPAYYQYIKQGVALISITDGTLFESIFTIPSTVNKIDDFAFFKCINIENIIVSETVDTVGIGAFSDCKSLKAITVSNDNRSLRSIDGVLYNKSLTELIACPTQITKLNIPNTVNCIRDRAFYGNKSLNSIDVPESVKSIGDFAFVECTSLRSVKLKEGLKLINDFVFSDCDSLVNLEVPSTIKFLGRGAFDCWNLEELKILSVTPPSADSCLFEDVYKKGCERWFSPTIYVPQNSVEKYKTTPPWSNWKGNIYSIQEDNQ